MTIRRAVFAGLLVAAAAGATIWWRTQAMAARTPPQATFPSIIDLGTQKFGSVVNGIIPVSNSGSAPLELSQFRTSCSCANVEVLDNGEWRGLEKALIAGKQALELRVRISVGAWSGTSQSVQVQFSTNEPDHPTGVVQLVIPFVNSDVFTDPSAVVFGVLRTGDKAERRVTVYDCGTPGRRIIAASCKHPDRFEVRLVPPDSPLPELDHRYAGHPIGQIAVLARTNQPGVVISELEIELNEVPQSRCHIPISAEVIGPIQVQPSVLYLPRTVSGRLETTADVRLSSRNNEPITAFIDSVPEGLSVAIIEKDRTSAVLAVTAQKAAGESASSARHSTIRVRVQMPTGITTVELPICFP
jgi:hypothetical protein